MADAGFPRDERVVFLWAGVDMDVLRRELGTWTIEVTLDGVRPLKAPIEVRRRRAAEFHRPSAKPRGLVLQPAGGRPAERRADEPLLCAVKGHPVLDDPDYDIVRYHYRWSVNGRTVRETNGSTCRRRPCPRWCGQLATCGRRT